MSDGTQRKTIILLAVVSLLSLSAQGAQKKSAAPAEAPQAPSTTQPTQPSLYERLGGVYNIATVVDTFIEKLLVDDVLNANPAIKAARERVPKAGLKYRVTSLVAMVTGGPEKYAGRSMKESHAHLNITEKEWQAMVKDFVASLDEHKVPPTEQGELLQIVEGVKPDIVTAAK
ncbi:MAG: group 1 truncated hemoglobin [Elusimicrobia bacterium]|nr:group 1 truncated hemoglobin [Elusimicrobiota bacterium]